MGVGVHGLDLAPDQSEIIQSLLRIIFKVVELCLLVGVGLIIGWIWRPRWVGDGSEQCRGISPPGSSALALLRQASAKIYEKCSLQRQADPQQPPNSDESDIGSDLKCGDTLAITEKDLRELMAMLREEDMGSAWRPLMEKSMQSMHYQAWFRDSQERPNEYRMRTVFEDVTPQLTRDFFWDDEFRPEWDDVLRSAQTLEQCSRTGYMVVHWVRKFPLFCKDREYIIARRIWQEHNTFYCVQKAIDHPSVQRKDIPRRVDVFYSSFRVRPVESLKGNGELTACEVMLFHYEDMGIQKDIAKLGIRQGMWGRVKKMEPGLKKYRLMRKSQQQLPDAVLMAQITTPVPDRAVVRKERVRGENETKLLEQKERGGDPLKWAILIGAVALAVGAEKGVVGKIFLSGIARRLGKLGKRL